MLDRHKHTQHRDTNMPTKYYHCTVDGCKYSSNGGRRKKFARVDQVKEHIKDYGHYAPHSANDRLRRPGKPLFAEHIITVFFEEWTLDGDESSLPLRNVQSCEYNSINTKLWHTDDIGELFLRVESYEELEALNDHQCTAVDCYYQIRPPEGLRGTVFKTLKGLHEHIHRAHQYNGRMIPLSSQLLAPQRKDSAGTMKTPDSSEVPSMPFELDAPRDHNDKQSAMSLEAFNWDSLLFGDSLSWDATESPWSHEDTTLQQSELKLADSSQASSPTTNTSVGLFDSSYTLSISDGDERRPHQIVPNSSTALAGHGTLKSRL